MRAAWLMFVIASLVLGCQRHDSGGSARTSADSGGTSGAGAAAETSFVHVGGDSATGTGLFVAWPAGNKPAPVVVVMHEWWGLNAQIRTEAERLAGEGYVAAVPDLYHGKVAEDPERAHILSRGLEYPESNRDIDSTRAWLGRDRRVRSDRVAVMGFCMGGSVALAYAIHDPRISALVMFYGPPFADSTQLASFKSPVMGHYGQLDEGIPPPKVEAFRRALRATGHKADIYSYPDAGHAFMNDAGHAYRPAAARLAWSRTLAFLHRALGS